MPGDTRKGVIRMCTPKIAYMKRLEHLVSEVSSGSTGSIVNDDVLIHDYTADMLEMVE